MASAPRPASQAKPSPKTVVQPHKKKLLTRMNRVAGQVSGIREMIDKDRYCVDILMQINAAKAALDGVALELLEDHTKHCVHSAVRASKNGEGEKAIDELIRVIKRYAT